MTDHKPIRTAPGMPPPELLKRLRETMREQNHLSRAAKAIRKQMKGNHD